MRTESPAGTPVRADPVEKQAGVTPHVLRLWETRVGRCLAVKVGHTDEVLDVQFDAAGNSFVSASSDGTARLYNTHTGQLRPWGRAPRAL